MGKNVPVRDEIAACNSTNKRKKKGGEMIIIAVKMWKATQKATSMSRQLSGMSDFFFLFTMKEDDKKETLCQWGCSSFAVQATGRQWWNGIHFMIITLILLCCSLVWCKELFFSHSSTSRTPPNHSCFTLGLWKKEKSIIFIDLLGIIIKQIN